MSYFDYQVSKKIAAEDHPFYALIMAAMRQADSENTQKLRAAWPEIWEELSARYSAPGGALDNECILCGHPMNPVDLMLSKDNGRICGNCCRANAREMT